VKEAFRIATDAGTVGMHLSAMMNRAFAVAKKVRTEDGISQSAVRSVTPPSNCAKRFSEIFPENP